MTFETKKIIVLALAILPACSPGCRKPMTDEIPASSGEAAGVAGDRMATADKEVSVTDVPARPSTIPAPEDVAAPPADAEKTSTGLASKVLTAGTGADHPTADNVVEVHYTGWTTDGKMFDSSVTRGKTISFPLRKVIAGWTEGVQLMVVGEKRRFWIPQDLAYKGKPGYPAGMLVFDVELVAIR